METHHTATERHPSYGITQCYPAQMDVACCNRNHNGLCMIYLVCRDERLSWPGWLVMYWDGLPVWRQSPIQVVTGLGVEQLSWLRPVYLPVHKQLAGMLVVRFKDWHWRLEIPDCVNTAGRWFNTAN